jgi:hypothetical protein
LQLPRGGRDKRLDAAVHERVSRLVELSRANRGRQAADEIFTGLHIAHDSVSASLAFASLRRRRSPSAAALVSS